MGTLIFWGAIVLAVFLGIVLFSLLSMAQKGEQIYDLIHRGENIPSSTDTYYLPATEPLRQNSSGEARAAERFKRISGSALITPEL